MIDTILIITLCLASAVFGRLVLTREQAWKTIKVRIPALALSILCFVVFGAAALIWAVICFIGGSFYGLYNWWLPPFEGLLEGVQYPMGAIVTGAWEP